MNTLQTNSKNPASSKTATPDIERIYHYTNEEVLAMLESSPAGLSSQQIKERQDRDGKNIIKEAKEKSILLVFLSNFVSVMAILLWVSGFIAILARMPELGIAIWCVNLINGVFSFWQEYQAGKATEALKKMLPSYSRVIRDGTEQQILAEDLVVGDIILVTEGDKISADARLLEATDLQVNQSTLTGESNPVRKVSDPVYRDDVTRSEIPNLIFAGTSVSSGNGKAVVISTGMNTMFGNIAKLTQSMKEEKSPLQKELDKLTQQISAIALGFGVLFFVLAVFFVRDPIAKSFIFSLGMVVAFIPEGLLPTVTLSLAMAVQRMAKEHALVKKLSAVETLGCTSVICSDKTGTLTQNEMTVSNLYLFDRELEVSGTGYAPEGEIRYRGKAVTADEDEDLRLLLTAAGLCSNARLIEPNENSPQYTVLGDPTEACLGVVARKGGLDPKSLNEEQPRIRELPFDSSRKRMTTIHEVANRRVAYVKGAPKEVIELCSDRIQEGTKIPLTDLDREKLMAINDTYARRGLRVLAVAFRDLSESSSLPRAMSQYTPDLIEKNMTFVGLIAMADPARPEVAQAVAICHKASIRVIMITGDYGLTAESIGKRIGIVKQEHPRIVTGAELSRMSNDDLKAALKDEVIFARVAPEQKYQVVSCLQEMGEIVAVTGDGVNDSPALKKADIGIAMGITGTDVAKEAADMILLDDNFASIVKAIEEGRTVYQNIRKFLTYILNSNMPEAVPSAFFLFSRGLIPLPLTVMQILTIDLGTDMTPALGLGTEPPEPGIMEKPPRKLSESLLNRNVIVKAFLWYGMLESVFAMAAYFFVNWRNGWPALPLAADGFVYRQATTMTLAAIVFCQIGMVMNCRTDFESIFKVGLFKNKLVIRGIIVEIGLILMIVYVPFLQRIFGTEPLFLSDWLFLSALPFIIIAIEEIRKALIRKKRKA